MSFGTQSAFGGGSNNTFGNQNQGFQSSIGTGGNSGNNVFGNSNTNPSNLIQTGANGIFAGNNPSSGNSAFGGGGNTGFNSNNGGSNVFGNNSAFSKPNTGNPGTGWGSGNTSTGTGVFGNAGGGGTAGNSVFGNQQTQQNTGGYNFGNAQQQQSNPFSGNTSYGNNSNPFGNQNNKPSNSNQSQGVFGGNTTNTFQNQNQTGFNTNTFGNNGGTGSNFNSGFTSFGSGNQTNTFAQGNTQGQNNSFGGTSWGVPTGGAGQNQTTQKFTPLKSKNHKIDHKHLVKCLVFLDENTGLCMNQLRARYVMGGGNQQQNSSFQTNTSFSFNQSNQQAQSGNKGFMTGAGNSAFSSFNQGGTTSSPFGGGGGTSAFSTNTGQNQQQTSAFGNTNATGGTGNIFGGGGGGSNQTGSFLGGGGATTNTSMFSGGNTGGGTSSFFSGNTQGQGTGSTFSFGQNNENKPFGGGNTQGSAFSFGGNTQNQNTGGMFSTSNNQGGSMFATNQTNGPLLGTTNSGGNTLFGGGSSFGGGNTPTMFGSTPQQQQMNPMQSSIPNANPDILQAIVQGGFFSPEFSQKFLKEEKTPFDKLIQNNDTPYEDILFDKSKKSLFSDFQKDKLDFFGKPSQPTYNDYKFKHPYDFGDDQYFNYIDFDREKEERKEVMLKKPEYKVRQSIPPLLEVSRKEKIQQDYNRLKDTKMKEKMVKNEDLPFLGEYTLSPSCEQLKNKQINQLKRVSNVIIENQFGKVKFLEPISLLRKNVPEGIEISQDSIEIIDSDWDKRECEMTFKNFGEYISQGDEKKEKLMKKMRRWLVKNKMEELDFNKKTGDLVVSLIL